jgi:hypothetical protein
MTVLDAGVRKDKTVTKYQVLAMNQEMVPVSVRQRPSTARIQ